MTAAGFAALMRGFEPFEPKPVLAAAVSGGPDSMCLCLLADRWARARGGRVEALIVDHRLRRESRSEARKVSRWLKARGVARRVLVWRAPKPGANVASAAREARYRLLSDECAKRGILHLLIAHHRDDQGETLLLRLARGSGVDGLSAMSPVVELGDLRILRPLLPVPKARLVATLAAMRQPFVEDPTNRSALQARARLRGALAAIGDVGLTAARLAQTASRMGRARQALEQATADLSARAVAIHPAGFVRLDPRALGQAPEELRLRVLARCLMTVGGQAYPPRLERLEALAATLGAAGFRGRTLHGCRIIPERDGRLLVCREPASAAGSMRLRPGLTALWDGRFLVRIRAGTGLAVGALGEAGWSAVERAGPLPAGIPRPAALTLPAIWAGKRLVAVPSLGWACAEVNGRRGAQTGRIPWYSAIFAPPAPLAPPGFAIALAPPRTT